jgi:predicted N-acetyltransferase YhbS
MGTNMAITLRRGEPADAPVIGEICYLAFKHIAEAHHFPPDLPSAEVASGVLGGMLTNPGFYDVVAEDDGRIVGSNFLDERNPIAGVGPITVYPMQQNTGAGRLLMAEVLRRAGERGFAGVRLVQAGYHSRSLALYSKLGFEAREQLACLQGPAISEAIAGSVVRPAKVADIGACTALCVKVHGHGRGGELAEAVAGGVAQVVERAGRVSGYATPVAFFGHAVGETDDDLKALIGAAGAYPGPGFLVPTRNGVLLRWALEGGLRIVQTMTLMTMGLYNEPQGAWLPSVLY